MKTKNPNFPYQNKRIIMIAVAVGFILLMLVLAMQFNDGMNWGLADFALAGALLFGAGLAVELVTRKSGIPTYRAALVLALAAALFLVWINLAVGIIGSEDNPANMMYFGVLAIGIIGALIAKFQSNGMARALSAAALAQVFVTAIVLITVKDVPVLKTLMLNGGFVALWLGSAFLFLRANETLKRRHE